MKEHNQITELLPGLTEEFCIPEYVEKSWVKEQPERVYRLDQSDHRYYYIVDEKGSPTFYTSVTTFLKQNLPTSPHLITWIASMGEAEAKAFANERADYGTFLHKEASDMLINTSYDLDKLHDFLMDYIEEKRLDRSFINYADDLKKDLLAFAQFISDYNVSPIAIEMVLTHKQWQVAGAIDLVCEMDISEKGFHGEVYKSGANKGKPKQTIETRRVVAIVDLKSGRKGFHESHELQLHTYKGMWEVNFPDIKIDRVFNWSPKDWRGMVPTYNLKDQTQSKNAAKLPHILALAAIENKKRNNTITITHGVIDVLKGTYPNIETIDLVDFIQRRHTSTDDISD